MCDACTIHCKNTAYHDLTGRFPHRSSRGMEYLIVVHNHDSNSILMITIKNKTGAEIKVVGPAFMNVLHKAATNRNFTFLTMKLRLTSRKVSKNTNLSINLSPLMSIDAMQPNELSARSRTISWLVWQLATLIFPSLNGTDYCFKPSSLWIFFALRALIQNCPRMHTWTEISISTKHPLLLRGPRSLSILSLINVPRGLIMVKRVGISALPWNIIDVSNVIYLPRQENVMSTPYSSFRRKFRFQVFPLKTIWSKLRPIFWLFFKSHRQVFPI